MGPDYVTRRVFNDEYVTTSKTTLNDETYEDVREETDVEATASKPPETRIEANP